MQYIKSSSQTPNAVCYLAALYRPLRPQTTSAREKEKDAHSAAQPRLTMNGSPSAVWASSCAAWCG